MISVFKREFRGYFRGYFGWILAAIQLLGCGFFSFQATVLNLSSDFTAGFSNLSFLLIFTAPIAAAYTFSCEHARNNAPWLNSLPVGKTGLAVGKYLAALSLLLLPSSVLLIMPPLLANMGAVAMGSAYTAILGYCLEAAALLSVCSLLASKIRNPILASVLCILLCAVIYFAWLIVYVATVLPWLALLICIGICAAIGILTGLLRKKLLCGALAAGIPSAVFTLLYLIPSFDTVALSACIEFLSPTERLNGFLSGHFDLPATFYLLSISILSVYLIARPLTLRALRKRTNLITSCVLLISLIACNIAAMLLPFRTAYADVSGSNTYTLSDTSKRYLSSIDEVVEIIYHSAGGEQYADRDLYPFLLQFSDASRHITVRAEDTNRVDGATNQTVTVRSAKRSRTLAASDFYYYQNTYLGTMHTVTEYQQVLNMILNLSDSETAEQWKAIYGLGNVSAYFAGDACITGAVRYVLAEEAPIVCVWSKGTGAGMSRFIEQQIEQAAFDLQTVAALNDLPTNTQALCLSATEDLSAEEAQALSAYLNGGGAVLLTTAYTSVNLPNLNAVLAEYGLSTPAEKSLLYESTTASQIFEAIEGAEHPTTDLFNGAFIAAYAHPILITETDGVEQTVLFQTSANAYSIRENTDTPDKGAFPLGVAAKKGDARLVWLSMMLDSYVYGQSSGADADFVECTLQWMTDADNTSVNTASKAIPSTYLLPTDTAIVLWIVFFMLLLPLGSLTVGILRVYIRKKR